MTTGGNTANTSGNRASTHGAVGPLESGSSGVGTLISVSRTSTVSVTAGTAAIRRKPRIHSHDTAYSRANRKDPKETN